MKKYFFNIMLGITPLIGFSQAGLEQLEHYLVTDYYLINPAYAGFEEEWKINGTYKQQYSGLEGSPKTQTLSTHGYLGRNTGVGVYFFNDENGATLRQGLNLSFAYHIPIDENYDSYVPNQFSFGISFNGYIYKVDFNRLNPIDLNDPLLQGESIFIPNINLGGFAQWKNFFIGASIEDIPLANRKPIVNGLEPEPTNFYGVLGYHIPVANSFEIEPSLLLKTNSNSENRFDLNVKGKYVTYNENIFWVGISYSQSIDAEESQQLQLFPMIGFDIGVFTAGYGYSIGTNDFARQFGDGHLISIGLKFKPYTGKRYYK
ncbi:MAG: PorP/SprF family type IX secretion system membrane protein [Flavobacteriales bacterium]